MPRLHLLRSSYDLFVCEFPYDFFGIVGGYDVCVYIAYYHLTIYFGGKLGQNLIETLRTPYDNRKVIVQSSSSLSLRPPYINRTMHVRGPCGNRKESVG